MKYGVTEQTTGFIAMWEDFRSKAYWDATGKVWTVGYGHTRGVCKDMVCTKIQAKKWLQNDCKPIATYLNSLDMGITQQQFDALVCLTYNIGLGNLKASTLLKLVRCSATTEEIVRQFYKWKYSGGKVLNGLVIRREGEAMLYSTGNYPTKYEAERHVEKRLGKDWKSK